MFSNKGSALQLSYSLQDEAQLVSHTNSKAAVAASSIYRRHAWVITGTPVTSKLGELQVRSTLKPYSLLYITALHSPPPRNCALLQGRRTESLSQS